MLDDAAIAVRSVVLGELLLEKVKLIEGLFLDPFRLLRVVPVKRSTSTTTNSKSDLCLIVIWQ